MKKMHISLDQSWKNWVALNLSRGCDNREVIQILLDHPFAPTAIIELLKYFPDAQVLINIVHEKVNSSLHNKVFQGPFIKTHEELQLEMENARSIDAIELPFALKADTNKANFYIVENFINIIECEALIALIKSNCKPSLITNPDEPDKAFRTSQTCDLGLLENNVLVQEIDQRISEYLGIEVERSETIQGQYYQVGQQFKTHTDYFEPNTPEYTKYAGDMGQRTWTFMIYLNAVELGGETNFPDIGVELTPVAGRAVVWNSLLSNGDVNAATAHCARPVLMGEKFVITKWFRTFGKLREAYQIPSRKNAPLYTRNGFTKLAIPSDLFITLQAFYHAQKLYELSDENVANDNHAESTLKLSRATTIELEGALRVIINKSIIPSLEEWVGMKLQASIVSGICEYKKGTTLPMVVDSIDTHLVSVALIIGQQVHSDWPLQIVDHMGKLHEVVMKPGEMFFYESARLLHGRTKPLDGEYFASIFMHTQPI